MNITDLDFKLLLVFQSLMKKRKVGDVALELNLSQPSVSRCLSRLREHFDDPLFVRTQHAMDPTPSALEIAPFVDEMLDLYHSRLSHKRQFDPAKSKRTFKIAASEIGHMMLFPRLLSELETSFPFINLQAVPLVRQPLIEQLESGEADIAFGSYPKLYAGIHERVLYREHYICLIRADHPEIKNKLSLSQYKRAKHIIVSAQGLGHIHEQAEKYLYGVVPEEQIRIVTHSFLTSALMVEKSNFIATVPTKVAAALGGRNNLRMIEPPIKLRSFDTKLYWHERFHREPGNQWLRRKIADLFT